MDQENTAELERLALSLSDFEDQLNRAIKTQDQSVVVGLVLKGLFIQEEIREKLAESPILNIPNPTARDLIQKVRDEKNLTSRVLLELEPVLLRLLKQPQDESKTSLPKEYDEWIQELLSYIEPEMFIEARKQVGALIVGKLIPKDLGVYFHEIKHCYIFGQHIAAVGLCRVLLEIALRDIHYRKGTHKTQKGKDLEGWEIGRLVKRATFLTPRFQELAKAIVKKSSEILHWKRERGTLATLSHESLSLMRKTFFVVEKLYSSQ